MTSGLLVELYFGPLISLRVEKESNTNTNPWNLHLRCPGLNSEFEEHCNSLQKIQHNQKTKQNIQLCFMFYLLSSVNTKLWPSFSDLISYLLTNLVITNQTTALVDRDSSSSSHTHTCMWLKAWQCGDFQWLGLTEVSIASLYSLPCS